MDNFLIKGKQGDKRKSIDVTIQRPILINEALNALTKNISAYKLFFNCLQK
jgi:hypothetical protein